MKGILMPLSDAEKIADKIASVFCGRGKNHHSNNCKLKEAIAAAKDLGCKAIGIEIEEKYCEIAVQRLRQEVWPLK